MKNTISIICLFIIISVHACSSNSKDDDGRNEVVIELDQNKSVSKIDTYDNLETVEDVKCAVFIGYRDGLKVFKDCKVPNTRIFFLAKNGDLKLFKTCELNLDPLFINDEIIAYLNSSVNQNKITIEGKVSMEIDIEYRCLSISIDKSLGYLAYSYFDGDNSFMKLLDLKKGGDVISIKEAFPRAIISGFLYFEERSDSGEGFINLIKVKIDNLENRIVVLKGVYGESLQVSNNGEYVACIAPQNGESKYSIFNIRDSKFIFIKDAEIQSGNYFPIFNLSDDSVTYYSPNNLDFKRVSF